VPIRAWEGGEAIGRECCARHLGAATSARLLIKGNFVRRSTISCHTEQPQNYYA
jgi:hypothetical protein